MEKRNRKANVFGKCPVCEKEFSKYIRPNLIRKYGKNRGVFCSISCYRKRNSVRLQCANCRKEFTRAKSKLKNSKHEVYFCSRKCKEQAQSLKGGKRFLEMRPPHYSTEEYTINTYRKDAFEFYGEYCRICSYNIVKILEVHHRDGNRNNNIIENLDVLCPTHHNEYQFGVRKY